MIALIPGWCMPAAIWENQLIAFGARHRAIALDPRGQGESDVPAAGYHFERRAVHAAEVGDRGPDAELVERDEPIWPFARSVDEPLSSGG